jgi:hypothetical protein
VRNYLRIGLIGVPGAGKSALAYTLQEAWPKFREPLDVLRPRVIDEYAPEEANRCDLAKGFESDYLFNLHVALERARQERLSGNGYISCGTVFDTAAYQALVGVERMKYINDAERVDEIARMEAIMKMFGVLYMDTVKYDHIFYLNGLDEATDEVKQLDRNMQTAFMSFGLANVHPLLAEGPDPVEVAANRCEKALDLIRAEAP